MKTRYMNGRRFQLCVVLVLILSLLLPTFEIDISITRSASNIGTRGRGDIYWNGTQEIWSDFIVPDGDTLHISPGTVVSLRGNYHIFVEGTILAIGNESGPVLFTSGSDYKLPGDWGSIRFNSTSGSSSILEHVIIEYADIGVECYGSSPLISNAEIAENRLAGFYGSGTQSRIENSEISWNEGHGLQVEGSTLFVANSTIAENDASGIQGTSGSSITLNDNIIESNGHNGVRLEKSSWGNLTNNSISFNGHNGISVSENAYVWITENTISNNSWSGIAFRESSVSFVENSTVSYNGELFGSGGIWAEESQVSLRGNYISHNVGLGIDFRETEGSIGENLVIGSARGISISGRNVVNITRNRLEDNTYGIYLQNSTQMILENNIMNNRYGIYSVDTQDVVIEGNVIVNSYGRDIAVGTGGGEILRYRSEGGSQFALPQSMKLTDLRMIDVGEKAVPTAADMDGDGHTDLVIGNEEGVFQYFRNVGGEFEDMGFLTGVPPFTNLKVESYAHPFVEDWDADGDLDFLIGKGDGRISFYANNGNGIFIDTGLLTNGSPNIILDVGENAAPYFAMWPPTDEYKDLIVGDFSNGSVQSFINQGGKEGQKNFTYGGFLRYLDGADEPIDHQGLNTVPWLVDWDKDTKIDLITSNESGVYFWKRTIADLFDSAIQILNTTSRTVVKISDWDNDDMDDLIIGGENGTVQFYKRYAGISDFLPPQTFKSDGVDLKTGNWSAPFPVDWDGDGTLDLVVGDDEGYVTLFIGEQKGGIDFQSGIRFLTEGQPDVISVGGFSVPLLIDWDGDEDLDLMAGGENGTIAYFQNNGRNQFLFLWNLSSMASEQLVSQNSAPRMADWNSDGIMDFVVGEQEGYVTVFGTIENDLKNLTAPVRLTVDSSDLQVGQRSIPFVADIDEDGDTDLIVGDVNGEVHYFERANGELFDSGYLKSNLEDLDVQSFSAPLVLGWEFSSNDIGIRNGLHFENSTGIVAENRAIRGGGGGYGIYADNSVLELRDNGWIAGGKGLYLGGNTDKSASGGHGIVVENSTMTITYSQIFGGDGSDSSRSSFEGGDGGTGLLMTSVELEISESTIGGGFGRLGLLTRGLDGFGGQLSNVDSFVSSSSSFRGLVAVQTSNATLHLTNGGLSSTQWDVDLDNASFVTLMNVSFSKPKILFRDSDSKMTVGWHLTTTSLDAFSNPMAGIEILVRPGTFTSRGSLGLNPAVSGPASPATANFSSPDVLDLLVGDSTGEVKQYIWDGNSFIYNSTLTKTSGFPVNVTGPCSPFMVDFNSSGHLDLFLGDANGLIWRFNNTGNGFFDEGYPLKFYNMTNISIAGAAVPRILDWDGNGTLDLILGGDGHIWFFENVGNDTFRPGLMIQYNGLDISHGSWSSAWTEDFDGDGYLDLFVGTSPGDAVFYLNDGEGNTSLGGNLKTNNSLLLDIDVGSRSVISAMDVTDDGHLDLLIGNSNGDVILFENNGHAHNVAVRTDTNGHAYEIPTIEYEQQDLTGDGDGDDEGERMYFSPSLIQGFGCGSRRTVVPLTHVKESTQTVVSLPVDFSLCPPIVLSTFPYQNQTNVPVTSNVTIAFDKVMNVASVQNALNISPYVPISQIDWQTGKKVVLEIGQMDFSTDYTLRIDGTAMDTFGGTLDGNFDGIPQGTPTDDYVLTFRTEVIPRVVSSGPTGSGISNDTAIHVCFNKPMDRDSVEQSTFLQPASTVHSFWWSKNGACAYYLADLQYQVSHTSSVSGDALDLNGNSLDGNSDGISQGSPVDDYQWGFTTLTDSTPPAVLDTIPIDGQFDVDPNSDIIIEFTETIDERTLATGLVVRKDVYVWNEGLGPGHFSIGDFGAFRISDNELIIERSSLEYDAHYEITLLGNISTGISDLAGNRLDGDGNGVSSGSPDDDYVFNFSTIDIAAPTVVFTYPSSNQIEVPLIVAIRAIFDDEMDESTLGNSTVSLRDEADMQVDSTILYYQDNATLVILPENVLRLQTTYMVRISATVKDTSQNILDGNGDGIGSGTSIDDYMWSFTTIVDAVPPSLQILEPADNERFTIGDIVNVLGTATDQDRVDALEMRIEGGNWSSIIGSLNESDGTWHFEWDTEGYEEGVYRIEVRARDPTNPPVIEDVTIRLRRPEEPFPVLLVALIMIIILVSMTLVYRYFRGVYVERARLDEQRKTELEEMLKKLEEEHEALTERAQEVEAKEMDLESKEKYLRDLDVHYQSLADSLIEKEMIDLSEGEEIVSQNMGDEIDQIRRYKKAFTLLSEAEASQAGELTQRLPESGKKALLLVYFNALEAFLREKLKDMIPEGATILLGEKGHINTRSKGWEEKWSTLSLGTLSHAIDHNKHFFVEDEKLWERTKVEMREIVDIRNLTAHPSETNPEVSDVREKVYSAILALSEVLKRPRELKK